MINDQSVEEDNQGNELVEDRLTVEVPTEIQAGRSSSDCYSCGTLAVA